MLKLFSCLLCRSNPFVLPRKCWKYPILQNFQLYYFDWETLALLVLLILHCSLRLVFVDLIGVWYASLALTNYLQILRIVLKWSA